MTKNLLTIAICSALLSACGGSGSDNPSTAQPESVSPENTVTNSTDGENTVAETPADQNTGQEAAENTTDIPLQDPPSEESTDASDPQTDENNSSPAELPESTESTDNDVSGDTTNETPEPVNIDPPSGLLNTAQPVFRWRAVANADAYKIVVRDADGSGYARSLDPVAAGCQTGEGVCEATTGLAYYDNDLTWYVESTLDGAPGPDSETISITTPLSENLMPIKSNVSDCEALSLIHI